MISSHKGVPLMIKEVIIMEALPRKEGLLPSITSLHQRRIPNRQPTTTLRSALWVLPQDRKQGTIKEIKGSMESKIVIREIPIILTTMKKKPMMRELTTRKTQHSTTTTTTKRGRSPIKSISSTLSTYLPPLITLSQVAKKEFITTMSNRLMRKQADPCITRYRRKGVEAVCRKREGTDCFEYSHCHILDVPK